MKVRIKDSNKKHYTHKYNPSVLTTLNFDFVQPLMVRPLYGNSKLKITNNQFVRLSPLTFPTFGKLSLVNKVYKVDIEEIFPQYAAFRSGKPYFVTVSSTEPQKAVVCKSLPYVVNSTLVQNILALYAKPTIISGGLFLSKNNNNEVMSKDYTFTFSTATNILDKCIIPSSYGVTNEDGSTRYVLDIDALESALSDINNVVIPSRFIDAYLDFRNGKIEMSAFAEVAAATYDEVYQAYLSADYIKSYYPVGATAPVTTYYQLVPEGRNLRKILQACGYNFSLDDDTNVCILPLFAYYKAYFNNFYPKRFHDWEMSATYTVIRYLEVNGVSEVPTSMLNLFLDELAGTYTIKDMDYFSMQTPAINAVSDTDFLNSEDSSLAAVTSGVFGSSELSVNSQGVKSQDDPTGQAKGAYASISSVTSKTQPNVLTKWSLQYLVRLQNYINKDSIIGNRISLWLKSHLNEETYNLIYRQTSCIYSSVNDIQIGDVDCTSGNETNTLGQIAGKGIGSANVKFAVDTNSMCYVVQLCYLLPPSGYFQGMYAPNCALSRWELPTSEFDALGYEVTPRASLWTDNNISLRENGDYSDQSAAQPIKDGDGFGYAPRFSMFKYQPNIVNGDFVNLKNVEELSRYTCVPWIMSRFVPSSEWRDWQSGKSDSVMFELAEIPHASSYWQYTGRYANLGSYNRIFNNSTTQNDILSNERLYLPDNFLLQCNMVYVEMNSLKPLQLSFETEVTPSDTDSSVHPA